METSCSCLRLYIAVNVATIFASKAIIHADALQLSFNACA